MNLPIRLAIAVASGLLVGDYLPVGIVSIFYTISMLIKSLLLVFLPLLVFSYLFAAMLSFKRSAPALIVTTLCMIVLSNAIAVITAYGVGIVCLMSFFHSGAQKLQAIHSDVHVIWSLPFSAPISSDKSLIFGIVAGCLGIIINNQKIRDFAFSLRDFSSKFLKSSFIPILPLYVFGFVLKLDRDGSFGILISQFSLVFAVGCILLTIYISLMYFAACKFSFKRMLQSMKEMVPAGLTAFSTMSSIATMPITLDATERNLKDRDFADFIIPATANNHLIGSGIKISLAVLALLLMSGKPFPTLGVYLVFVVHYCLVKFSAAGVPGGAVIVVLPIAQEYLGLGPTELTILTTAYLLQNPIVTLCNVLGNGAFAMIAKRVMNFFKIQHS